MGRLTGPKLGLGHKALLYEKLRSVETSVSEYSFANLYLFRRAHDYEVIEHEGHAFVSGRSYDGMRYVMPTADLANIDMDTLLRAAQGFDFIFPVPEERLGLFPKERFSATHEDGDSDYVYNSLKMRTYAGRDLHRKRNLMKQYMANYSHEAFPLTSARMPDAKSVLDSWLADTGKDANSTDYDSCREALELSEDLLICGGMYYADGEPAGFVLGEERPPDTFVLHFAKARVKFKGVYQYIFNHFASLLPEHYKWINLEQDLNIEALRIAKASYQPDRLLRKYRVKPLR